MYLKVFCFSFLFLFFINSAFANGGFRFQHNGKNKSYSYRKYRNSSRADLSNIHKIHMQFFYKVRYGHRDLAQNGCFFGNKSDAESLLRSMGGLMYYNNGSAIETTQIISSSLRDIIILKVLDRTVSSWSTPPFNEVEIPRC